MNIYVVTEDITDYEDNIVPVVMCAFTSKEKAESWRDRYPGIRDMKEVELVTCETDDKGV